MATSSSTTAPRRVSVREQERRARQSTDTTTSIPAADTAPAPDEAFDLAAAGLGRPVTAQEAELARTFFAQGVAQDLDEVAPEPVAVTLREYIERAETDADGHSVMRRRLVVRRALIETFVPMQVFNRMMADRRIALLLRAGATGASASALPTAVAADAAAADDEPADDPMLDWMQRSVLRVWRLTEPDMTLDRLALGLSFQQMQGLFARFFGELLRQSGSNLHTAAPGRAD